MISPGAAVLYSKISWLAVGGKRAWDRQSETLSSSPATNYVIGVFWGKIALYYDILGQKIFSPPGHSSKRGEHSFIHSFIA